MITFYGILWLEGANDVIADHLDISLYLTTEIARYAIFIGPVVAYWVTKRICLGLQRKDTESLAHGYETGIIEMTPEGEFIERHAPVPAEQRAVLIAARPVRRTARAVRRRRRRARARPPAARSARPGWRWAG